MKIPNTDQPEDQNDQPPSGLDPDYEMGENGGNSSNGNHTNGDSQEQQHLEDAMFGAVDKFCSTNEQTYDQFLQCFSHFKPNESQAASNMDTGAPSEVQVSVVSPHYPMVEPNRQLDQFLSDTSQPANQGTTTIQSNHDNQGEDDDKLEEETLDAGSTLPQCQESGGQRRPMVKMDNFVDDEASLCEDDDEVYIPSGFSASFGPSKNESVTETHALTYPDDSGSQEITEDPAPEAFNVPDDESHVVCPEILRARKSSQDLSLSATGRFDSAGKLVVLDTSGITSDPDEGCVQEVLVYDPEQDLPNPGEITDYDTTDRSHYPTIDDVLNVRQMGYSAKIADSPEILPDLPPAGGGTKTGPMFDEVEPFMLDEDFDYDNVILTPKYSASDMKRMAMLRANSEL